jgi:hypothetical protein
MEIKGQITEWLNGPQEYREGLFLLGKITKKWKLQEKLLKKETKAHKFKLLHELQKYLNN